MRIFNKNLNLNKIIMNPKIINIFFKCKDKKL